MRVKSQFSSVKKQLGTIFPVEEFRRMPVGHRTVGVVRLRSPRKKENGFLEFMRQVRRRRRDTSPGRWTTRSGPTRMYTGPPRGSAYLLRQEVPFGEFLVNISPLIHSCSVHYQRRIPPLYPRIVGGVMSIIFNRASWWRKLKCTFGHK